MEEAERLMDEMRHILDPSLRTREQVDEETFENMKTITLDPRYISDVFLSNDWTETGGGGGVDE